MIATLLALAMLQPANDLAALTQGVTRIASPGVPGPIATFGRDAFVVVDAKANQGRLPVVAATRLGRGKIVAFGHGGYLSAPENGDTRRLLANSIRWTGRREAKVYAPGNPGLAAAMASFGITAETGALDWSRLPASPAVIVLDSHAFKSEQIPAMRRFLESGGGWVTAGLGWGWQQVNRNQVVNLPANALLREAGIVIADGFLDPDGNGLIDVKPPTAASHSGQALEALRADTFSGAAAAVDAVRTALTALPADHPFAKQVASQVMTRPQPAIGPSKPLGKDAAADRLAVVWYDLNWPTWPAEEVGVHPSAALFPGTVPVDAARETLSVNMPVGQSGYVATGVYCPPGEVIRITISGLPAAARVRIGPHDDENWHHERWERFPHVSHSFPLGQGRAEFAHPFGGLIYIETATALPSGARITIEGGVKAPLFRLGETTDPEWMAQRNAPGPWAEIEGKWCIISVPSSAVRQVDSARAVAEYWDSVRAAQDDLAGATPGSRKERIVADAQISAGYMHAGYPIMTWLDVVPLVVDVPRLREEGTWGHFHELGHNMQQPAWTFEGTGEVTNNVFTLYCFDQLAASRPEKNRFDNEMNLNRWKKYVADGASFDQWKSDPFLALTMYAQLQSAFGWDAYKRVFRDYRTIRRADLPKNDAEKRDQWMVRFSQAVGRNLAPFFDAWRVPIGESARDKVVHLPVWMPQGMSAPTAVR